MSTSPSTSFLGGATVYAKHLERVARFYEVVCGLKITLRDSEFVVLENGPLQVVAVQIPDHIACDIKIASPPDRREDTALKLAFAVASILDARRLATEMGGVIDAPEREWLFRGWRVCDGHDPEGNVIQVRENAP